MFWKFATSPEEISSSMETGLYDLAKNEDNEIETKVIIAIDNLNKAAELLDQSGEYTAAELITNLITKIAEEDILEHFYKIDPVELKNESDKEVGNLKENGWMFEAPKAFPKDAVKELEEKYEMNDADDEDPTWEDE
jgi:hypothetical protein